MRFIGQHHIMNQLKFILPNLLKLPDKGANILLRGPSGYGKTSMAHSICRYLSYNSYQVFNGESSPFTFIKRVIFIDEIHTVDNLERLYHEMDKSLDPTGISGSHIFLFASNHDGNLPEAFVNRCWDFIMDDYEMEELILIARESSDFSASDGQFSEIVQAGSNNPRIIKSLCTRLSLYFRENSITSTTEINFSELISGVFSINNGMDKLCIRYIEALQSAGGTASITLLRTMLHIDENSLKNNVEPLLIKRGILNINSKGRNLIRHD